MKSDVTVVIVNYKTKDLIKECLESIYFHTKEISFDIIVVDNDSNDGIELMLDSQFPLVKFIKNNVNLGFGSANNVALEQVTSKYTFLLNPDTILLNNAIKILFDAANTGANLGCLGCFLEDSNGNSIHSYGKFLSYWYDLFYTLGYSGKKLLNLKNKKFIKPVYKSYNELIEVDYVTGADMFIPSKVLEDVGLFDDNFFMYSEEVDLQFRMKKKGYKRLVVPDARIIHLEGKSFSLSNSRRIMMNVSKIKYVEKHNCFIKYYLMKSVVLISGIIGTIADFYYKEYSFNENIHYLRCILNEKYN